MNDILGCVLGIALIGFWPAAFCIGDMRNLIRRSYPSGVPYYERERAAEIEDRLRTYMLNGTEPEELRSALKAAKV